MKKLTLISLVFALCLSIFSAASAAEVETGIEIGNKAPDFKTMTLDGEEVQLSDFEGEEVLLNFWATWCPPCREEMPDMQQFYEQQDVTVLAVNLTDTEMNENNVSAFIKEFEFTFPILMDKDTEISNLYRVNPIPVSYMLDSNGVIQHKSYGPMDYETMVEQLELMQ
jgi:peroxiredoxin